MHTATIRADEPTRLERRSVVAASPYWDAAFERTLRQTVFRGLGYTTTERAARLYASGSSVTDHLTIVEHIGLAKQLAAETRYDFILMAGPQESQSDDILAMAKRIHAAGRRIPPLYVDGKIHPDVVEFLPLFAFEYGLREIYRAKTGQRINLR